MTNGTSCGACRHWKHPRDDFTMAVEFPRGPEAWETREARANEADKVYGECGAVEMGPAPIDEMPAAVVLDGSQYFAALFTRAEFGCTLWEAR